MNQKRIFMYLGFAVYQVTAFIFTVMVDGHLDLLGLLKYIPWFKYISFLGVAFFVVDVVWYWMDKRMNKKKQADLENENNMLKAKIYDCQEAAKATSSKV